MAVWSQRPTQGGDTDTTRGLAAITLDTACCIGQEKVTSFPSLSKGLFPVVPLVTAFTQPAVSESPQS